jgi:hypothetical protein
MCVAVSVKTVLVRTFYMINILRVKSVVKRHAPIV